MEVKIICERLIQKRIFVYRSEEEEGGVGEWVDSLRAQIFIKGLDYLGYNLTVAY